MITEITTYYENALDLVISQFLESGNLKKLIKTAAEQLQICETKLMDLLAKRMLDYAEGEQLDGIGRIVDEPRNGLSDEDYRDTLALRIAINTSGGEAEIIIAACVLVLSAEKVQFKPLYPANVTVWVLLSALQTVISVDSIENETNYTITINGTPYTITSDTDATALEILEALTTELDNQSAPVDSEIDETKETLTLTSDDGETELMFYVSGNLTIDILENLADRVNAISSLTGAGIGFYLTLSTNTPFVLSDLAGGGDTDGDGLSDTGATSTGGTLAEVFHGI